MIAGIAFAYWMGYLRGRNAGWLKGYTDHMNEQDVIRAWIRRPTTEAKNGN
jgi:hypothetical protein